VTLTSDLLELPEVDIAKHSDAALALLDGFDYAPRVAQGREAAVSEGSPGLGSRRPLRQQLRRRI
tara:strand:+ start:22687 stop:22881 length:195 start_codon:yes stop_codon:yes gene_type:complete